MKNFDVLIGAQWGDEGKGKIVDHIIKEYDGTIRYNGGANAGHTVYCGDKKVVLHQLPISVLHTDKESFITNGCVLDLESLFNEIKEVETVIDTELKLSISDNAHIVLPDNKMLDKVLGVEIGTTGRGIGPTYSFKMARSGKRLKDLKESDVGKEYFESFVVPIRTKYMVDGIRLSYILNIGQDGYGRLTDRRYLLEGAQGFGLDIDFGTYPFVTSSNTGAAGACTGSGISPTKINKVIGIAKAYTTRVGNGPFIELTNEMGNLIRERGKEYGATTGRPRRCGWLDIQQLRESCIINDISELALNKLDILSGIKVIQTVGKDCITNVFDGWDDNITGITEWDKLPYNAKKYVESVEKSCGTFIKYIGTGPDSNDLIVR